MVLLAFYQFAEDIGKILLHIETHILACLNERMVFKQNFTLHFFYGDSVNAIQIQTWVVLIAKFVDNGSVEKHQEALCFLSCCYHGTTHAYVLR